MSKDIKINDKAMMRIDNGALVYKNRMIQICNISKMGIDTVPKKEYPIWAIIGLIISVLGVFTGVFTVVAIILAVFFGIVLYCISDENRNPKMYLFIALNDGEIELFGSSEEEFLYKAFEAIVDSIKQKKNMEINFSGCTISGTQNFMQDVVVGEE